MLFRSFSAPTSITAGSNGFLDVELVDVNGDGDLDAAMVEENSGNLIVLSNNGAGVFSPGGTFNVANNPQTVTSGDLDGDGDADLVALSGNRVTILTNDGTGNFASNGFPANGRGPLNDVELSDVDLDGDLDIVAAGSGNVNVYANNGDATFQMPFQFSTGGGRGTDLAVADVTGDGLPDAVVAEFAGRTVSFLPHQPLNQPTATVTVQLSQASSTAVSVDFATAAGSAISGVDFTPVSGTLTFAPGTTTATVSIPIIGDRLAESPENFFVNFTNASGSQITDGQAQVLINDDDGGPPATAISINNASQIEGSAGQSTITFTVSLAAPSLIPVTVGFATGDITATAGSDYAATTGSLTFAPGVTQQQVTVTIVGDPNPEVDEQFAVNLLNPMNAVLQDSQGIATLNNDDGAIAAVVADDTLLGGDGEDTLIGSIGNDVFNGQGGDDSILGGDGNDSLLGGQGNDTLDGQAGDDTLDGQGGDDVLLGSDGNDTFATTGTGAGNDTVDGGDGFNGIVVNGNNSADTISITAPSGAITVTNSGATIEVGTNVQIVTVNGLSGDDLITIGDLSAADQTLVIVNGGDGNDTITGQGSAIGGARLELNGNNGDDTIIGSEGADSINGGAGNDAINGRAGNDSINGGDGNDVLAGGADNDSIVGGAGNDFLTGQTGDDNMAGGDGNDTLRGFEGADTLQGQAGDDLLNGMDGDDSILGGVGKDHSPAVRATTRSTADATTTRSMATPATI